MAREKKEKKVFDGGERRVTFTFTERILGSQPLDREIYERYIKAKAVENGIVDIEDEGVMLPDEEFEKKMTGFFRDNDGIYLLDYQIKGQLKEAANVLKDSLGVTNARSKISQYVFVLPRRIKIKDKADGILQRPLRAMTIQGPRVSLAASEYVEPGVEIELTVKIFPNAEITWEVLEKLFEYGKFHGIGQWANGGFGVYTWSWVE